MQRLIHVAFGNGNVILETSGHWLPLVVNGAQHGVAITYCVHNYTHGGEVVHLFQRFVLLFHLFVDGIEMLCTPIHVKVFDVGSTQLVFQLEDESFHYRFPFRLLHGNALCNFVVRLAVEVLQAQIFQLAFYGRNTQSACNGCKNVQRFLGNYLLFFRRKVHQRTHIVQTVGKFYHHYTYVLCHCKKHLAHVFRLFLFLVVKLNFVQFGYACNKVGNFVAELFPQVGIGNVGVLHRVVQKRSTYRGHVKTHVHKNVRHYRGVRYVRSATCTELSLVCLLRHFESVVNFGHFRGMIIMPYF